MDTSNVLAMFARIGARLKVADRPSRLFRVASGSISLDIVSYVGVPLRADQDRWDGETP